MFYMKNSGGIKQKVIEENVKLFDGLADVFDKDHGYIRGNYLNKIVDKDIEHSLSIVDGNDVLDVGGGTGYLALKFLKKDCRVDVIDISSPMLDILQKKTKDKINLFCGNAEDELNKLTLEGKKYDIVTCSAFLHHVYNFEKILDQMLSLVKKNGAIYILNEPLKGLGPHDYVDAFVNKLMNNRKDLIPAAMRGIFGKELFWDYDTCLADCHMKKGLPHNNIIKYLKEKDFKIIHNEKYTESNYKIFYIINKYIFRFLNGWFKIIAQKT